MHLSPIQKWIKNKDNHITSVLFILLFFIIGMLVLDLRLFLDDFVLVFPSVLRSYSSHFIQYTYDNGLFRPFALLYYYLAYTTYLMNPQFAHIFIFLIHGLTSALLFYILRRTYLPPLISLLLSFLYLVHPFASEQYMWLSANPGTLVNFILLLQIVLIIRKKTSLISTLFIIAFLSLISIFTYESTFFLVIPLIFLIIHVHRPIHKNVYPFFLVLIIPYVLFLISKIVYHPHVFNPRLMIQTPTINQVAITIDYLYKSLMFFTSSIHLHDFWLYYGIGGLNIILKRTELFIPFLIVTVLLISKCANAKQASHGQIKTYKFPIFLFISLCMLLIPLLFNSGAIPIRTLFLPSYVFILFTISFIFHLNPSPLLTIINRGLTIILTVSILFFLLMNVGIAHTYTIQSKNDEIMSQNIENTIQALGFSDQNPVRLILTNMPLCGGENYAYTDFPQRCMSIYWCAQARLNMITGVVTDIRIERPDKSISESPSFNTIADRMTVTLEYSSPTEVIVKDIK